MTRQLLGAPGAASMPRTAARAFTRPAARDDGLNSLGDVRCASRAQRAERRRPQTR